ncbi:hypothetical protein MNV49_007664 [Pseudohyphozyma bogoriensis]|nr:hypothetical protein MNV49_007664 [Pseudohyphozyma bogoriensis]
MPPVSFHPAPAGTRAWAFPEGLSTKVPPTISKDGTTMEMQTVGKTDWWRTTFEWRSSGASYMFPMEESEKKLLEKDATEELRFSTKLTGDWTIQL